MVSENITANNVLLKIASVNHAERLSVSDDVFFAFLFDLLLTIICIVTIN